MIRNVLPLVQTLFDIILLRKGPDAIPHSPLLFIVGIAMWLLSGIALIVLFDSFNASDLATGLMTAVVGWTCYAMLLNVSGKSSRMLRTLTSIAGCGALLTVVFIAVNVFLGPFLGADQAFIIAYIILLWSVPVEGHIISRAIDGPWFVGFMFAVAVFLLQIYLDFVISPNDGVT